MSKIKCVRHEGQFADKNRRQDCHRVILLLLFLYQIDFGKSRSTREKEKKKEINFVDSRDAHDSRLIFA